ncbi:hypothetical protein ACFQT0_09445 [Hymenobacter humi]|uniref:Uncharacterized protein n=1 Tax=Hymenobacter humi TaxID=1411620 RepID=A0ABW2U547_9BACT
MLITLSAFLPSLALAQVYTYTFTAKESGDLSGVNSFYDKYSWTVTSSCSGTACSTSTAPIPPETPGSLPSPAPDPLGFNYTYKEVIVIDGIDIVLLPGKDYTLGENSSLTILSSPNKTKAGALIMTGASLGTSTGSSPSIIFSTFTSAGGTINVADGGRLVAAEYGVIELNNKASGSVGPRLRWVPKGILQ